MFALAPLAVLALALGVRADLIVSTPASLTQCQQATFDISGSTQGPYYAFIVKSDEPCGDALKEIDNITGNSFTWNVDVPSGTSVMIALESEDGTEGWSGAVTIGSGDGACLTGASSSAPSSTSSSSSHASTARSGTTYVAPENVAPSASLAQDQNDTSGASRSVVGVSSIVALVGAAVAALSL